MDIVTFFQNYYHSIDYRLVSDEFFYFWSFKTGLLFGFLLSSILLPLNLYAYKSAAYRCEKMYPDENVVYVIKNGIVTMFLATFCTGFFVGKFIFPFFIFKNLYRIKDIYYEYIWLYIILFFITVFFLLERYTMIYVLSDKNLRLVDAYNIFRLIRKETVSISYKDIKSIEFNKFLIIEFLILNLKNGKHFSGIYAFSNLKKVKRIIEKQLKYYELNSSNIAFKNA